MSFNLYSCSSHFLSMSSNAKDSFLNHFTIQIAGTCAFIFVFIKYMNITINYDSYHSEILLFIRPSKNLAHKCYSPFAHSQRLEPSLFLQHTPPLRQPLMGHGTYKVPGEVTSVTKQYIKCVGFWRNFMDGFKISLPTTKCLSHYLTPYFPSLPHQYNTGTNKMLSSSKSCFKQLLLSDRQ